MPRSPDSPTDTYLDVLRTLGVTDAALRRHHEAGPETSLRVAIDADRGSPTADLLAALEATGRLLDLRDGLSPDEADRLTPALARFGLRIEGAESEEDDDSADQDDDPTDPDAELELRLSDDVTGATERISTATDPEAVLATLREELTDADAIAFVELLDGRHLVADARELDALAERYGPRIQPFDDPLLVPDAAIEVDGADEATEAPPTAATGAAPSPSPDTGAASEHPAPTPKAQPTASDDQESFGEFVSAVDDSAAEAVEEALADGEPETHTIEDDGEEVDAASTASIGGGPRRTVSTSGIDDVFAQLESSAPADDDPATNPATTTQTMSESSDPPTDPSASTDDADTTPNGLTGGPTRTVSSKSADDILEQATGDSDFETIAAEEGDADPDAVLADAEDVPPALEDADVAAELSAAEAEPSPDRESVSGAESAPDADAATTTDAEPATTPSQEPAGAADVPPADPAASADAATEEAIAAPPADGVEAGPEAAAESESGGSDDATAAEPAPPTSSAGDADEDEQPSTLEDDLLEDDVELRRGSESVEEPAAPAARDVDVDPDESADADGPLAAAGGVSPPEDASEEPPATAGEESATVDEDSAASDASNVESGDVSNADPSDAEEPVEGNDPGLVGRITSTIFGR